MGRYLYPDAIWISPTAIRYLKGLIICPTDRRETEITIETQDLREIEMAEEAATETDVRVAAAVADEAEIVDPAEEIEVRADGIDETVKKYRGGF